MNADTAITDAIERIYGRYSAFDAQGIESGDAEDCTIWDLWNPPLVRGKEERAAFRAEDMANSRRRGKLSIQLEPPVVTVHGPVAVARYYLDFVFEPPNATSGRVRVTTIFEQRDGAWKRVHHHEGVMPAGRPPLTE